jgi:hypothetical protein
VLTVKRALFALSGEYRGHLFLPSEGEPPMWGCWAIERRKEIDTRWIEAVEEALKVDIGENRLNNTKAGHSLTG